MISKGSIRIVKGLAILGMVALILGLGVSLYNKEALPFARASRYFEGNPPRLNVRGLRDAIRRRMAAVGPDQTYKEVTGAFSRSTLGGSHIAAHLFGELLYEKEGVGGVVVCDDTFGFGCYHGFFGRAIGQLGIDQVRTLDRACADKFGPMGLGCPHGIGHGLGEYFGPGRLLDQLAVCATLGWQGQLFGCQGGVFMEYNFPTVVGESSSSGRTRPFDAVNPYAPCTTVPARFARACYLEQTTWWQDVLHEDYQALGTLCLGVRGAGEQEDCFRGIGYSAAPKQDYSPEKVREICSVMPTADAQILCRAGAAWSFFANPQYRALSPRLCEDLEVSARARCQVKSDLLGGPRV